MRLLSEQDMRRLGAAVRKADRISGTSPPRRYPVFGAAGGGMLFPSDRVSYTSGVVQLTRNDRDKLIWYDSSAVGLDGVLKLPPDPVIGDTFWFIHAPSSYGMAIRPARNQGVYSPYDFFVKGYWFDIIEGSPHYQAEEIQLGVLYSTLAVTWCVMQYTGKVEQVPIGYNDIGGPAVNPNPGDGNAVYYDAGIDTLVYAPITMWTIWRCRGRHPARQRWKSEDFPY
jgi:hypothetical protein